MTTYTLVQHSGYVATGHPEFALAVESRAISAAQAREVLRLGGVIGTYSEIDRLEYQENYPEGHSGLVPSARGHFLAYKIDGAPLYVPPPVQTKEEIS